MSQQWNDEKQEEKQEEKTEEKQEKDEKDNREYGEKWRSDPMGRIVGAVILIWAGIVFLVGNTNGWAALGKGLPGIAGQYLKQAGPWELLALGAGLIFLAEVLVRILVPEYRRPVFGTLIFSLFLIGLGTSAFFNWEIFWPVALVALGLVILLRAVVWRR